MNNQIIIIKYDSYPQYEFRVQFKQTSKVLQGARHSKIAKTAQLQGYVDGVDLNV